MVGRSSSPSVSEKNRGSSSSSATGPARAPPSKSPLPVEFVGFELFPAVCLMNASTSMANSNLRASSSSTVSMPLFYQPR
ncbi:hypothetical protein EJB05_34105, partial [Eragrostis curvula]